MIVAAFASSCLTPWNLIQQNYKYINYRQYNMVTTIQVREDLLEKLAELKKEINVKTYEDVIRYLLRKTKVLEKSYFGAYPQLKSFEREKYDRFD